MGAEPLTAGRLRHLLTHDVEATAPVRFVLAGGGELDVAGYRVEAVRKPHPRPPEHDPGRTVIDRHELTVVLTAAAAPPPPAAAPPAPAAPPAGVPERVAGYRPESWRHGG